MGTSSNADAGELLALRRRYMAVDDRCGELDVPCQRASNPAFRIATERRAAVGMVALTTIPETLGDVAALLMLGFDKAQDLDINEPTPAHIDDTVPFIMRAFALALPLVVKAAGVPMEAVANQYDLRRLAPYTAAMEVMAP